MNVAVTSAGKKLDSALDGRFGRCPYFILYDTDTDSLIEVIENSAANATGGAGIQAGQIMVNKGVQAVLTGNVGPNAMDVLSGAGIQVYTGISGSVQEAIDSYKSGNLSSAAGPTVKSHTGMGAPVPQPPAGQPAGRSGNSPGQGMGMGRGAGRGGAGMGGNRGMGRGGGRSAGRGRGFGAGPPADCVCPSCGERIAHTPGTPCRSLSCPNCNTVMVRGD